MEEHLIPTMTHGRVLVREARAAARRGVLVGFHGYMESAATQMARLEGIPGSAEWTLVSIQGLHRVYRGRTDEVVASWMTREDRDAAIADNLAYVTAALEQVPHDDATRLVYAGFSQGVAMAFRAGVRGSPPATAIVSVGGDVPPELLADTTLQIPPVLLARGNRDEWLKQAIFDANAKALAARGAAVRVLPYDGAHEWNDAVSAAIAKFLTATASRGH